MSTRVFINISANLRQCSGTFFGAHMILKKKASCRPGTLTKMCSSSILCMLHNRIHLKIQTLRSILRAPKRFLSQLNSWLRDSVTMIASKLRSQHTGQNITTLPTISTRHFDLFGLFHSISFVNLTPLGSMRVLTTFGARFAKEKTGKRSFLWLSLSLIKSTLIIGTQHVERDKNR